MVLVKVGVKVRVLVGVKVGTELSRTAKDERAL